MKTPQSKHPFFSKDPENTRAAIGIALEESRLGEIWVEKTS
jgi:hypothetical protein